ncbi:hypothetical protein [Fusobacterium polymorphum]|uniref:hypothetical protein n=1 Tax=Fusobacterium nucleatum subsp. polymorphum TaxID=76857 RepID=UPI0030082EA4
MKKIIVIMVLTFLSFVACDKINEKDKKKIITTLIKGIKKDKDFSETQDYRPTNHLVLSNNKEYYGKTENEEFYKILNELLGEDYSNIIQKY